MKSRTNFLAASLDGERKARRGFGKGVGGPTPKPRRPGVDPATQTSVGQADAEEYPGPGNTAPPPRRPGVSPAPRQPATKRAGDQATGQRGRKDPKASQGPNNRAEIGVRSRPTSL